MRNTLILAALLFTLGCQPTEDTTSEPEPESPAEPAEEAASLDATVIDGDVYAPTCGTCSATGARRLDMTQVCCPA